MEMELVNVEFPVEEFSFAVKFSPFSQLSHRAAGSYFKSQAIEKSGKRWAVMIYPTSKATDGVANVNEGTSLSLSAFLVREDGGGPIRARFKIMHKAGKYQGQNDSRTHQDFQFGRQNSYGFPNIFTYNRSGIVFVLYLHKGLLTIKIDFSIREQDYLLLKIKVWIEVERPKQTLLTVCEEEIFPFELFQILPKDLQKKLSTEASPHHTKASVACDFTIECNDETFMVEKARLIKQSLVFAAMLNSQCIEATNNSIKIDDVDSNAMKLFVEYVQYDCVHVSALRENAICLFELAMKYSVDDLIVICMHYIERYLQLTDFVRMWSVADRYNYLPLKEKLIAFAGKNLHNFVTKFLAEYQKLSKPVQTCIVLASYQSEYKHLLEGDESQDEFDETVEYDERSDETEDQSTPRRSAKPRKQTPVSDASTQTKTSYAHESRVFKKNLLKNLNSKTNSPIKIVRESK